MVGPLFYLHLVVKRRTAASSGSFHPLPLFLFAKHSWASIPKVGVGWLNLPHRFTSVVFKSQLYYRIEPKPFLLGSFFPLSKDTSQHAWLWKWGGGGGRSRNRGGATHIGGVGGWNRKKTQALWGLKRIQFGDPSCSEGKYHYRYEIGYDKRSQEILDFQEWTNTKPRKIQPMQCNIFKCLTHLRGTFFVLTILGCLLVDRFLAWSILLKKK